MKTPAWPALAALALSATACPLPQSLPAVDSSAAAPRIPFELLSPQQPIIDISKGCPAQPVFRLRATIVDADRSQPVEARWFQDYDPATNVGAVQIDNPAGSTRADDFTRPLRDRLFLPPDWQGPAFGVHVVELVVSNGFRPLGEDPLAAFPNRTTFPGYDTQVFRWVFRYVDAGGGCE